jgi:hypothetical protein
MVEDTGRGQSGLDRLVVFVVAVLAVLLVAPTLLGFVGIDVRERPEGSDGDVKLTVLDAEGSANGTSVGAVRLEVVNTGTASADMSEFTAIWSGSGSYDLVPVGADAAADGEFRASLAGGEGTVLAGVEDRGVLVFDLGSDDVDGVGEFGQRLQPGETVTVTLVAGDGTTVQCGLTVPETVPAEGPVDL